MIRGNRTVHDLHVYFVGEKSRALFDGQQLVRVVKMEGICAPFFGAGFFEFFGG